MTELERHFQVKVLVGSYRVYKGVKERFELVDRERVGGLGRLRHELQSGRGSEHRVPSLLAWRRINVRLKHDCEFGGLLGQQRHKIERA